ncbi:MAG: nucleotidyltransferase [Planctomycetes bacterium]|nr:nucleotidyltransferase [Planctomycetota bacterium]
MESSVSLPEPDGVLLVEDVHQRFFRTSVALSLAQVKNVIPPLDIIKVLNANGVKFVLVGAHGIAGWMRKPRATQDVDLVVMNQHVKKATRALLKAFPQLEAEDEEVVVRLRDRESKEVLIDLLKQRELYREVFKHTQMASEAGESFRIPSLELALAMKYAAMISPNRPLEKVHQDAHDFIVMVKGNPKYNRDTLQTLGEVVFSGGGEELLEMIRKAAAGERLDL